ncbi:MAG: glycoside hydrolase [Desulfobulbaceae bacterium]|nr:glycoside hydrolase [Desulfobulbaceae bacterium]
MKKIRVMKYCALSCLIIVTELLNSNLYAEQNTAPQQETLAVWSQAQGDEYPVLLVRQTKEGWSRPEKLSNNGNLNLVPSITIDQHNETWIVWSSVEGKKTYLLYKRSQNGNWSEEKKLETGFSSNTAPSIVVDNNNVLWLTWAAFDGQDDEIFTTFWNGSTFTPPVRITDNQVPDILPIMSFDSATNNLSVEWQGYANGTYETFQTSYNDGKWSKTTASQNIQTQSITNDNPNSMVTVNPLKTEPIDLDLPEFLLSQPSLSLHVRGKAIQSLPARLLQIENE